MSDTILYFWDHSKEINEISEKIIKVEDERRVEMKAHLLRSNSRQPAFFNISVQKKNFFARSDYVKRHVAWKVGRNGSELILSFDWWSKSFLLSKTLALSCFREADIFHRRSRKPRSVLQKEMDTFYYFQEIVKDDSSVVPTRNLFMQDVSVLPPVMTQPPVIVDFYQRLTALETNDFRTWSSQGNIQMLDFLPKEPVVKEIKGMSPQSQIVDDVHFSQLN